jgi:predicted anti-sigma-YlaC factor YlaD
VVRRDCEREAEILRAIGSGHVTDDVREHVASCAGCADLFAVASAVVDDRRMLMREAPIPSSGLVWWQMNMRARQEARRVAVRTATVVQVALVAIATVVAVIVFGATPPSIDYRPLLTIPVFAFVAWLILAPVAVYFAVTED